MESELAQLEIKRGITDRWKETDPEYVSAKAEDTVLSQTLIYSSLRDTIVKRHLLKAKYAGRLWYIMVLILLNDT